MKKTILNEGQLNECRLLTEEEVKERIRNTPKIDVEALLNQGCIEAKKFHRRLENGNL